jgi:hypothetical protein
MPMWAVLFHPELEAELAGLPREVAKKLAEVLLVLRQMGPQLGRPLVDTLKGSRFPNMKELRFSADGVWRFAFAFDPKRQAILLAAIDKRARDQTHAYARLTAAADRRYAGHLKQLEKGKKR